MARCIVSPSVVAVLLSFLVVPSLASMADNWTNPDARLPSFSSTYLVGERIYLSWQPMNTSWNDLWLVRPFATNEDFALRIATTIDISIANAFPWTVAVSQEEVLKDTRFEFVFIPQGSNYNASVQSELQSPTFNLMMVNQASPPNGTVVATTSTPALTSSVSSSSATDALVATTLSTASPSPEHGSKLDYTQIAGIVVGVLTTVALLVLLGGYLMLMKKRKSQDHTTSRTSDPPMTGPYEVLADSKRPSEVSSKEVHIYELKCSDESLAHESDGKPVHEIGNTVKRPGLHEMPG